MSIGKRSNIAIWRLTMPEDVSPSERIDEVVSIYGQLVEDEPFKHQPLRKVEIVQDFDSVSIALYVRRKNNVGLLPFIQGHLSVPDDVKLFRSESADACLFIATKLAVFAITSGAGYRIIEGLVDYSFPFDTAKKLIANNFSESAVREFAGTRTSRVETYRRGHSIDRSDTFGKVWKKLVGRIDSSLLANSSYLRSIIDPARPPAVEIKAAFVLRKRLDLAEVVALVAELETLPEPNADQALQLSFLDNLYPIKNNKDIEGLLTDRFVENLRQVLLGSAEIDLDMSDPGDITRYNAGSDFKIGRLEISTGPPDKVRLVEAMRSICASSVRTVEGFRDHALSLGISYSIDPDDHATRIRDKLINFLHGEVDYEGQTYFRLDKIWYRSQGDFLENLKRDFIEEVFSTSRPVLLADVPFLTWRDDEDEDGFNKRQALVAGFHYGDKIFARSDRGKIELFDLLKVDEDNQRLYIVHSKDKFDAKMRDACSQIVMSSEVIDSDLDNGRPLLTRYFDDWKASPHNADKGISKATFLKWFDLELVYVVLCSTRRDFVPVDFENDALHSHIARREILATKNEFKGRDVSFRLAHTRRQ
ncbi:hypothetical protein GCM10009765_03550 [Fodinicola feengrottensis]|uniref:TIGR04141 family sporadically distributed protein n=1 Tax=Fodinicola feengrottensis TaxID=435914 RepID=A0ABN2FRC9_9ACTN